MSDLLDCFVVGGGPAGLTAAIYLARFHLLTSVIDSGDGRAAMIPITRNHAGYPDGISGLELLERMRKQAVKYGVALHTGTITSLRLAVHGAFVGMAGERAFSSRTVLLASGVSNRRPPAMAARLHDEAVQQGLLRYCPICDGYEVTDLPVGVVGTGERGLAEAEFLRSYTANLTLIAPDGAHRFDAGQSARAKAAGLILLDGPCLGYSLQPGRIEVELPQQTMAFASLYAALGTTIRSELAVALGARVTEDGCPIIDQHQRTSVNGLYAAGDLVLGLDQISHAMGQAGVAATSIRNDLAQKNPRRR